MNVLKNGSRPRRTEKKVASTGTVSAAGDRGGELPAAVEALRATSSILPTVGVAINPPVVLQELILAVARP
jgi:hypothetical protein